MANIWHKVRKQYIRSVNTALYVSDPDVLINPDISAVEGFDQKYWDDTGDVLNPLDQAARDALDAAEAAQAVTDDKEGNKARIDDERVLRAFAEVVMDEINILRATQALPDRTLSQLVTAIKNKIDAQS